MEKKVFYQVHFCDYPAECDDELFYYGYDSPKLFVTKEEAIAYAQARLQDEEYVYNPASYSINVLTLN